jgi:hypothetical protein
MKCSVLAVETVRPLNALSHARREEGGENRKQHGAEL